MSGVLYTQKNHKLFNKINLLNNQYFKSKLKSKKINKNMKLIIYIFLSVMSFIKWINFNIIHIDNLTYNLNLNNISKRISKCHF